MTNSKADVDKAKIGDKVVLNERGRNHIKEYYHQSIIDNLENLVYFIITQVEHDSFYVRWINHKGMIIYACWRMPKHHVVMYEGSN